MKKKLIFPIVLIMVLLFAFALVACSAGADDNVSVYTVRFNNNYDGGVTKIEVEAGESFALAEDPSRPGYKFAGWYLDADGTSEKFTASTKLEGDITVFAKWEKDDTKCVVIYKYLNYGTADTSVVVEKGGKATKPADPKFDENEMCAFGGWFTDAACTAEFDFNGAVDSDVTLYAKWTPTKTTVTFDANYVGAPAATKVIANLGGTVARPEDPTRARYEFGDWYTSRVGGSVYDFATTVDGEITLYAHWARSEYSIMFDLNGGSAEGVELSYSIKRGASASEQAAAVEAKLSYTGHVFAGWYSVKLGDEDELNDDDKADLSSINDDIRVYAGWELEQYSVSFDYNYSGAPAAPATQKVKYGKTVNEVSVSSRPGYVFVGWFTDAACTTQFTFDMPVTGALTLSAKWVDSSEAGGDVTVTYYYVVDGIKTKISDVKIPFGETAESKLPEDPKVADCLFGGWYTDEAFTTRFNVKANLTASLSVYGKMLKKNTLEAEAVNLEGKRGQGTSTNSFEEQMIMSGSYIEGGNVSNGYFIREQYFNGANLVFEIYADEDVDDAIIYLRVSSESYRFRTVKEKDGKEYNYLSDDEFRIYINEFFNPDDGLPDTYLRYGGLYMPMANTNDKEDLSHGKTPFEDCFIAANVSLKAGMNSIILYVNNNNDHGGTFHAEAPIIDCMYIYTSTYIEMNDYEYYTRPNVTK